MAGIIEKYATNQITIRIAGEISDGKTSYVDYRAVAMISGEKKADMDNYGTVQDGKTFLIAPNTVEPTIPGEIVFQDETYTIKSVKPIRNIKGVLWGYRVIAAGGA